MQPDGESIGIGGHALDGSKKWRDLMAKSRVAFVVDDLKAIDPWTPRGIEIRGRARLHESGGFSIGMAKPKSHT